MNQNQLTKITKALKDNTRGMTVTQISKEIKLNRNSVAKYLEVLLISGNVEMRSYGPAKVFFLSQRVPMSALIDFSSDYIIILDRDLKIVQVNDNFLKLVNLEREDLFGQKLEDTSLHAFNTAEMKSSLNAALTGKRVKKEMDCSIGGTQYYCNLKIIPTTFDDGLPGVTLVLEDITERKEMERELKKSEERYRKQFEEAFDAIFLGDAETGIIIDCNRAATRLVGRTKSELVGKHQSILHPPEKIEEGFSRTFKQHLKEKIGAVLEEQVITKTGEIRDVEIKANFFEVGNKRLLQGIFRDVTERRKAEDELVILSNVMKMSTHSIVITDINAKILNVNEATLKMYGATDKSDLIGKNSFDFIAPEHYEKASAVLKKVLEKGSLKIHDFKIVTRNGTRKDIAMSLSVMKGADGKPLGLVAIISDISEHKKTK